MVNAKEAFAKALDLLNQADIDDALHNARLLFQHATNLDYLLLSPQQQISTATQELLFKLCTRRASHEPLQYILGTWQFMNVELVIGEGVLIPRSDSECVCQAAIEKLKGRQSPTVLDLCAGSGALALGIKSFVPTAKITAVELSPAAFLYLEQNCNGNIQAVKQDVLQFYTTLKDNSIDLIISNPPYVSKKEMEVLQPELSFEPQMALTDNGDGLSFYRQISRLYYNCVSPNGWLVFEIGSTQGQTVMDICKKAGWKNLSMAKDLEGRHRVILAQKAIDTP